MIRRSLPNAIAISCVTAAWPSTAAEEEVAAGLVNTGVGMFVLAIASALLVTLLVRVSAGRVAQSITSRIRQQRLSKILSGRNRQVLRDFILPGAYGGLTRIDYAVLTSAGVLCIRINNCDGVVIGDSREPQWTNIADGQRKTFLNPIIQSEGRAKALQKVVPMVPVAHLVVFVGAVQYDAALGNNIVRIRELASYITELERAPPKIDHWDTIWMSIKAAALTDEESRKDFAAQLSFS